MSEKRETSLLARELARETLEVLNWQRRYFDGKKARAENVNQLLFECQKRERALRKTCETILGDQRSLME